MKIERIYRVLLEPHNTEKTVNAADRYRQNVFKVRVDASKSEIKKAVEALFGVTVLQVRTANMPGKQKRSGQQSNWKKAWVSLPEGQDIDLTRLVS